MITKNRLLIIFGILITLLPISGFPHPFDTLLIMISGIVVTTIAFIIAKNNRTAMRNHEKEIVTEVYSQKSPTPDHENDSLTY